MKFSPVRWIIFSLVLAACALLVFVNCVSSGDPGLHLGEGVKEATSRLAITGVIADEHQPIFDIAGIRYRMSLDQIVVADVDGRESDISLNPPASRSSLAARSQQLAKGRKWYPILMPEGLGDHGAARCLVTTEITIQLPPSTTAQQVVKQSGLVLKAEPSYAPGFAIFSAADPVQALEISQRLALTSDYPLVEIQLAKKQSKRSLPNDPLLASQWHLKFQNQASAVADTDVNVENAWLFGEVGGVRGAGIRIGIVDDGVQTNHPDLVANIDSENDKDWNSNDNDANPALFDDVHGTSCAGNAAARGNNGIGVTGTAPEATLVGLRLISGSTTDTMEAEAMAYRNDIIHIKSNSWGPSDDGYTMEEPGPLTKAALQTATTSGRSNRGTIFLWAGGNGGYSNGQVDNSNFDGYANSIYTIAIGALDSKMRRAEYSERGSNLVVVSPSDGASDTLAITTTDRTGSLGYSTTDYATDFGGTSSATPTAAGIVALMLEKNPNLGWRDVQEVLIRSAKKINPSEAEWALNSAGYHFNHNYGAGLIDATAAVNLAASWVNRPARVTPIVSSQTGLGANIPDGNALGVTRSFVVPNNIRVEQVTVKVNITHNYRGDIAVTLISPSGMASKLAEMRPDDSENHFSNWTFSSVRHWGELSQGTWTLRVADLDAGTTGILQSAELQIYGSSLVAPQVNIASPANQQIVLQNQPVNISINATGNIDHVDLKLNGVVVATDSSAPFTFVQNPSQPNPIYTAVAVDSIHLTSTSQPVSLQVVSPYQLWVSGFPQLTNNLASADPDGDGLTNEQEFAAQTDPSNATSVLKILNFSRNTAGTQATITWQSVNGVSYQLQKSENLSAWNDVGAVISATNTTTSLTFSTSTASRQFFRIRTAP
jgi:subtilisin-like proprotein convertase family protein